MGTGTEKGPLRNGQTAPSDSTVANGEGNKKSKVLGKSFTHSPCGVCNTLIASYYTSSLTSQILSVLLEPTAVSSMFPVNLLSPGLPGKHMSRPKHLFFTFCLFLISERFHLVTWAGLELVTLLLLQPLGYSGKLALPGRILTFCTLSLCLSFTF